MGAWSAVVAAWSAVMGSWGAVVGAWSAVVVRRPSLHIHTTGHLEQELRRMAHEAVDSADDLEHVLHPDEARHRPIRELERRAAQLLALLAHLRGEVRTPW